MRRSPTSALWLVLSVSLLGMPLSAQIPDEIREANSIRPMQGITGYESAPNTAVIVVHAFADEKPVSLDRSARVDLTNVGNHLGVFLIVHAHNEAVFTDTILGKYVVSVTAVGYLSARQEIDVVTPARQDVDIVLRRDPAAIALNEASGLMSKQAKKEASRAVSELKSGRLADARKHLEKAYAQAPSNADLNFLLGYLHFEQKDFAQAGNYLRTAASLSPQSAQTLTLLGRTKLEQQDYPAARSALERAILVDPENWLPHHLLAYTYLHDKEYSKARDEAQIAVAKSARYGKSASEAAEITLGQSLIALGQKKEGIEALQEFLKDARPGSTADQVQALITRLEQSDRASAAGSEIAGPAADPLMIVPKVELSMQTWRPPDIDDVKPIVEPGVSCPSAQVLAGAGQRAQELVQDVTRFSAQEDLFHKSLDSVGLASSAETRKYDYLAAISSQPGSILIEDYRQDRVPQGGSPGGIASTGFVMLGLVFHPSMQGDFDFDCEGQGEWRERPAWLVHFRQRHDRPNHMQTFKVSGNVYRADLKGRAWIDRSTFQIVHIEADLTKPVHEVQLLSEHQVVEYGPVPFAKKNTILWLPKNVEIYLEFRKHRYYRRYSYDHYMLFDVDVSESRKPPADTARPETAPPAKKDPN